MGVQFKYSEKVEDGVKTVATIVYESLSLLLKDARIISFDIGNQHDVENNTTMLRIVYGYNNYDNYCLRIDFPHEGAEYVHLNNISPGGTSCNLFTQNEFMKMVEKGANKDDFVSYSNVLFGLKERVNISDIETYKTYCRAKEHSPLFPKLSSCNIEDVREFFLLLGRFHIKHQIYMDRSDEPKDDSFRLAKLMELLQYYVLSFYCGNDAPKSAVQEKMLSCGRRYGLINEGDDQILLLISLAAERVFKKLL